MTGKGEVGFDGDAAGAVSLGSGQFGELAGEPGRSDARSPDDRAAGDALRAAVVAVECDAGRRRSPITVRPVRTVTPRRCSDRSAFAESEGGKLVRTRSAASTSTMRALAGIDSAEVAPQCVPRQFGDLAGHLDTGRPGADDDESEPGVACLGARLALGGLEGGEQPATHRERTLERLDLGGVHPPVVMAEVRVVRAAGDDQRVVAKPLRRRHGRDRAQVQLPRVEVEVGDLGQQRHGRCGRA